MRFYLDEMFAVDIAQRARELLVDVVSSHERGYDGFPDQFQL
ncbi:MAG: hypothetical protein ACR2HN_09630 [Tepidiformaceae bacterium]